MPPEKESAPEIDFDLRDRYDVSTDVAIDASQERVVIVSERDLIVIDTTSSSKTQLDAPADDVAIDGIIYVLQGEQVSAITENGIELWSESVPGATEITSTADGVAVLTERDEVLAFEGSSGAERFSRSVSPTDLATDGLYSVEDRLLASSWTYLTCIDPNGEEAFERNLDGKIAGVGTIGSRAFVALKNGMLTAVDDDGSTAWTKEIDIRAFSASGSEPLLAVQDGNGLVELTERGEVVALDLPAGDRAAATDGIQLVCTVDGETATVYERNSTDQDPSHLDVDFEPAFDGADDRLVIELENSKDEVVSADINVTAQGASVTPDTASVTLEPSERSSLVIEFEQWLDDEALVEVAAGTDTIGTHRVSSPDRSPPEVELRRNISAIRNGKAVIELGLKNSGETTLRELSVLNEDIQIGTLSPGDIETWNVTRPVRLGEKSTVTIVSSTGTTIESTTIQWSGLLNININERTDLHRTVYYIKIENNTSCPITDRFYIDMGFDRLPVGTTNIPGSDSEKLIIYPPESEGVETITIDSDGLGVIDEETIDRTEQEIEAARNVPDMTADQELRGTGPFIEELKIANNVSEERSVTVHSAGNKRHVEIPPRESTRLVRWLTPPNKGEGEIPRSSIETGNYTIELEEENFFVTERDSSVQLLPTAVGTDDRTVLVATVHNNTSSELGLTELTIHAPVGGGDSGLRERHTETLNYTLPASSQTDLGPVVLSSEVEPPYVLELGTADGSDARPPRAVLTGENVEELPITLTARSVDPGSTSTDVMIEVENVIGTVVTVNGIEATGSAIDPFYDGDPKPKQLAPATSETHRVEISPDGPDRIEISVEVEFQVEDDSVTTNWEITGSLNDRDGTRPSDGWEVRLQDFDRDGGSPRPEQNVTGFYER